MAVVHLHDIIEGSFCNLQSVFLLTLVHSTLVFQIENPSESVSLFCWKCCTVCLSLASPPSLAFILLSLENLLISPLSLALSVSTTLYLLI